MIPFPDTPAFEHHFCITQKGIQLLDALAAESPPSAGLSKTHLKQLCHLGAVWVAEPHPKTGKTTRPGRFRRGKKPLLINSEVSLYFNAEVLNAEITPPTLIADEQDFSVWYKPKGMLSQGSKWGDHTTLHRWVESQFKFDQPPYQRPCWSVHRLDRATDGLMLLAHSKKSAQRLTEQFEQKQIQKRYHAWVKGAFEPSYQRFQQPIAGKSADTEVQCLHYDPQQDQSLLDIQLHTGRKHQIRIHLSAAGFPIVGDRLYGDASKDEIDLQLTAVAITLTDPQQPTPQDYQLPEPLRSTRLEHRH